MFLLELIGSSSLVCSGKMQFNTKDGKSWHSPVTFNLRAWMWFLQTLWPKASNSKFFPVNHHHTLLPSFLNMTNNWKWHHLVHCSTPDVPLHWCFTTQKWHISRTGKKCIPFPQLATCLQSSVLSLHIHLQSSLRNAQTVTFWSSLSVPLHSAAGSVLRHVGLNGLQRKLLSKSVRVLLPG